MNSIYTVAIWHVKLDVYILLCKNITGNQWRTGCEPLQPVSCNFQHGIFELLSLQWLTAQSDTWKLCGRRSVALSRFTAPTQPVSWWGPRCSCTGCSLAFRVDERLRLRALWNTEQRCVHGCWKLHETGCSVSVHVIDLYICKCSCATLFTSAVWMPPIGSRFFSSKIPSPCFMCSLWGSFCVWIGRGPFFKFSHSTKITNRLRVLIYGLFFNLV